MTKEAIDGLTVQDIISKYGCHRATAFRAVKRGYIVPKYHVRSVRPLSDMALFPTSSATKIATAVFWRHFRSCLNEKDDIEQESLLRMIELSGKSIDPNFLYSVAINAMRNFLKKKGNKQWIREKKKL